MGIGEFEIHLSKIYNVEKKIPEIFCCKTCTKLGTYSFLIVNLLFYRLVLRSYTLYKHYKIELNLPTYVHRVLHRCLLFSPSRCLLLGNQ